MELAVRAIGSSPLLVLVEQGNVKGVETLVHDKNLNQTNELGQTPLHLAIENENAELANLFLSRDVSYPSLV
jgi:ankyrin repeat protein